MNPFRIDEDEDEVKLKSSHVNVVSDVEDESVPPPKKLQAAKLPQLQK